MNYRPAFRNDAIAKVCGKATYTDDIKVFGMVHAVPVYTDAVSAKLLSIDVLECLREPDVLAVFTSKDIPGAIRFGQIIRDYPILADDVIFSNGDVIALVVASTREAAIKAAEKIKYEVEHITPVLDAEAALDNGSPLVHPDHGSNICNEHRIRTGDMEKGEAGSHFILEEVFTTQRIEHAYLEPEVAIAIPRSDGVMEIYGSMQHPFSTRRFVANLLGSPLADVEVKTVPMGGGFGGKDDTAAIVCARAALCAKLLNRPVKIRYEREWSLRESYKRHPYKMYYRMGLSKNGLIHFVKAKLIADGGAYCSVTPWVTWRSTVQCCGAYRVPNVHCDTYGVYTNNVFSGAMRGFGSPQVNFAIEQLMDMAAQKCGITEREIRYLNMLRQNSSTITGQVLDQHRVSLREAMDAVLNKIGYEEKRKQCSMGNPDHESWYGIGFAISYRGMSLGAEGVDFNSAIISVQPDGSVLLETGIHENGQGSESAMILIAAEELGIPAERIRYRQPSTSNIPDGGTTVASRGTIMGGGAVVDAASILKEKINAVLKEAGHGNTFRYRRGKIYDAQDCVVMNWDEAIKLCYNTQCYPYAFGVFKAPQVSWDEHSGQGNAYFTWVYACQAVELSVDPKTGAVKLLNMVAAHDLGKAINPPMAEGQFYGGMAMATGYALYEDCRVEEGKVITSNFHNYRLVRATDMPEMKAILLENADPNSPSSAKGIGEPTNELMAPAIANAIYNATGKRHFDLPIRIKV